MQEFIEDLCENFGTKEVTKTDKSKGAFVPNEAQRIALSAAGFEPGDGGENAVIIKIETINDMKGLKLSASYYNSMRKEDGRKPETRMGRDLANWVEIGDLVTIANVGSTVFAWKSTGNQMSLNELAGDVVNDIDIEGLLKKARQAKGRPPKQEKTISDFRRNAAIVVGALARAGEACEMPGCSRDLFKRADGSTYLEVHHMVPLAEQGEDTMTNAAALCPACHRELHYGANRLEKRLILQKAIAIKEA